MNRAWMLLGVPLLAGCLFLAQRPCSEGCPDGYGCETDGYGCKFTCDDSQDCADGFRCLRSQGTCVEASCLEGICPNHLACDGADCLAYCVADEDCLDETQCCTQMDLLEELCGEQYQCF